jgi:UDP-2,3-diacylglucosamine pyrophosphatase LpxH
MTTDSIFEQIIERIAHLADIHIPKIHKRHAEYREVFMQLVDMLRVQKPERIVIVGDLYHDKLNISNEAKILAAELLNILAEIAPVRITRGNHDFDIHKKTQRMDCIQALVELIRNPRIVYYNQSGFFRDENLIFVVWHHGDHYSPWNELGKSYEERQVGFFGDEIDYLLSQYGSLEAIKAGGYKFIDLYHDPVKGCRAANGMVMEKDSYLSVHEFQGDVAMLGDIHQRDFFDK